MNIKQISRIYVEKDLLIKQFFVKNQSKLCKQNLQKLTET